MGKLQAGIGLKLCNLSLELLERMYCVLLFFFFSELLFVNPLSLFTSIFSLHYTGRKSFILVRMDIKYILALKIMQVNIRSKLVHCNGLTDVSTHPFLWAILP